jgi:hypothetical protein
MSNFKITREVLDSSYAIPSYFLSVSSNDLAERKKKWELERKLNKKIVKSGKWVGYECDDVRGGFVVFINAAGLCMQNNLFIRNSGVGSDQID